MCIKSQGIHSVAGTWSLQKCIDAAEVKEETEDEAKAEDLCIF